MAYDYLSMLGLELIHVSKGGPSQRGRLLKKSENNITD